MLFCANYLAVAPRAGIKMQVTRYPLAQANAVLAKFHNFRRRDVAAGQMPTVMESLAAMSA